jgi:prefoldin subunit 5
MSDSTNVYADILKYDDNADGTLTVYGKATDGSVDIDQQICDPAWLDKAMPEWFRSGGNIREQHSNIAAGVAKEYESKSDGHYISALVVDPVSVKKVQNRVLRGFSIGIKSPRVVVDKKAANGRIIDGQIVEVSLVDRPANPNCQLVLAKSINGEKSLTKVEELVETTIEKELVEESMPMNGEAKSIPSSEEMLSRYATAKQALDEVTMMCKEYGYELPSEEKQYGESAEEESAEGPAGSGAEHELEETKADEEVEMEKSTLTEIIPSTDAEDAILPTVDPKEFVEEDSSTKKSLLADVDINSIVEKAVKSAMKSVEAEVAELKSAKEAVENKATSLEQELATAKSLAIGGGPKRTTIATGSNKPNEALAQADLYFAKASATTDHELATGYRMKAKEFLAKATTSEATSN